jgi:SAM-dependent methyltransferase
MYDVMASIYDVMYSFKDYPAEAARIDEIIRARNPAATTLLDVACGTGKHLEQLRTTYDVEGTDVSAEMLAVASARLPGVALYEADMRELSLGRTYDAITCLFSAIGYARSVAELHRTIAGFAAHLAPSGVLLVEPWLSPDDFEEGRIDLLVREEPKLKVARLNTTARRDNISVLEFQWLVGTPSRIEHFAETHEVGMFTHEEYLAAFRVAGLRVDHDPEGLIGRGLYIGVRMDGQSAADHRGVSARR